MSVLYGIVHYMDLSQYKRGHDLPGFHASTSRSFLIKLGGVVHWFMDCQHCETLEQVRNAFNSCHFVNYLTSEFEHEESRPLTLKEFDVYINEVITKSYLNSL